MEYADGRMLADKESGIGWMTFNNPARRNAMTMEMWQGADAILADFEADPEVRVIVLKGAGDKAFVSGADISQFEKNRADAAAAARYAEATDAGRRRLATAEKPVIAMIRGFCMGGGLGIAMTCDLRFAAEGSEFGIPAARLGIAYNFENVRSLVGLVGPARAKDILFSGRRLPAEEAYAVGADRPRCAGGGSGRPCARLCGPACGERAALDPRLQAHYPRGDGRPAGARGRPYRGARQGLLRQRRLPRGPHRLHGKAPPGLHRRVAQYPILPPRRGVAPAGLDIAAVRKLVYIAFERS